MRTEPSIDEIQQFITTWCPIAKSTDGRSVVRWDTVKYGIKLLRQYRAIRHRSSSSNRSFELLEGDIVRLDGTMQLLERRGHISRDILVPRVPIGILAIRELILIIMRTTIWHGTISWSFTMQDVAMITIIASLNARAGDVLTPAGYEAHTAAPFLTYEYVDLVVRGTTVSSVQGRWRMRNCKGEKYVSPCLLEISY